MSSGLSVAYNQIHPNLNSEILKEFYFPKPWDSETPRQWEPLLW